MILDRTIFGEKYEVEDKAYSLKFSNLICCRDDDVLTVQVCPEQAKI